MQFTFSLQSFLFSSALLWNCNRSSYQPTNFHPPLLPPFLLHPSIINLRFLVMLFVFTKERQQSKQGERKKEKKEKTTEFEERAGLKLLLQLRKKQMKSTSGFSPPPKTSILSQEASKDIMVRTKKCIGKQTYQITNILLLYRANASLSRQLLLWWQYCCPNQWRSNKRWAEWREWKNEHQVKHPSECMGTGTWQTER